MMVVEKTNETKLNLPVLPGNEKVFLLYALWRSLPMGTLKNMTPEEIVENLGLADPRAIEIAGIRTQKEFAEKYGLSQMTLVQWNVKIDKLNPLGEARSWARHLAKNMLLAVYNHGIKKGNPLTMKLFFQIANEWEEKSTVKVEDKRDLQFIFSPMKKPVETLKEVKNEINATTDTKKAGADGNDEQAVAGLGAVAGQPN